MKLYIAEKPSLGRAIAAALPKPHKNQTGFIEVGNGDVVSWCIGHILEQADPEIYNEDFKKWRMEHLPIIPQQWQLKPKSQTRAQLTVLRKLVKSAHEIIHAGDPDRATTNCQMFDRLYFPFLSKAKGVYGVFNIDRLFCMKTLTKSASFLTNNLPKLDKFPPHFLLIDKFNY